jgi:beta-lactamase regulating signal transducer with metallopeptidase domain
VVLFRLVCPISFQSSLSLLFADSSISSPIIPSATALNNISSIEAADQIVSGSIPQNAPAVNMPASGLDLLSIAGLVWLLGAALLLGYGIYTYLRLYRKLTTATLLRGNIFESDYIQTPFVMGFINFITDIMNYI